MKALTTTLLIFALMGASMAAELPTAPTPQAVKSVEHDPGAWGATTVFTTTLTGAFTRPWIGFAAGVVVAALPTIKKFHERIAQS